MIPHVRAVCAAVVVLAGAVGQSAFAQMPKLEGVTGIHIEYKEPANPAHRPIYDRLKKRTVLEQYKEFLSPLRLSYLSIRLEECNEPNAFYRAGDKRISYCYEYVADTNRQIAQTDLLPGFRREDAVVGAFVSTLLHETGHAIFHLLDIPVFGREEDAADAIGYYVALQFGPTAARRILAGTAFAWRASELDRVRAKRTHDYSDTHGTDAQRFYNTLCVALGSDLVERTKTFSDFLQLLPERRRRHCPQEYLHVKNSFARLILPHVDLERMKKVRSMEWLRSEDGTELLPPPAPSGPTGTPGPSSPGPKGPGSPLPGPTLPGPR